jgi:hypothetical protein
MNSRIFKILLVFLFGGVLISGSTFAEGDGQKNRSNRLNKPDGSPIRAYMNINNVSTVIKNDGISDIDEGQSNSGLVYPKGSGKQAVFQSGLIWGAFVDPDPQVRLGGSTYATGLQAGRIRPDGTAESDAEDHVRIYRVRPVVSPGVELPEDFLKPEADDEGKSQDAVHAQYILDWEEWPATYPDGTPSGAPFDDRDGNGVYEWDPNGNGIGGELVTDANGDTTYIEDIPGVPGADQSIWFVANDLEPGLTTTLYGAQPLGVEVQATFWAYAQTGALGNMFFRKYKIINKSGNNFRDMYLCFWSDVDLGNSTDDFVGADTVLSLSYSYNANASDPTYTPLPPPVVGFDFFQGPILDGVAGEDKNKNGVDDAEDFGIFDGKRVGPGRINLPMTAAFYFVRGAPDVTDPPLGQIAGSNEMYNFMQGRIGLTGRFFVDPITGDSTTFTLPGDVATQTGWVDGLLFGPGDRRQGLSSGPFQMADTDTQEIVVAEILAGAEPGIDRISAIGLLKFYSQQAQVAYDNFFDLPTPPPPPAVNVIELDRKIVFDWGVDMERAQLTESSDAKGYAFQGYNVYQLPTASSQVAQGVRLATYDIVDGVGKISDFIFDPVTGSVVFVPVQFGNDTGIERVLSVTTDAVNQRPLINGSRYYFAVTAYNFNDDLTAIPNNLENPISIITVVPQSGTPGEVVEYTSGDTVDVEQFGTSDGSVSPIVVDPSALTGHNYEVTFDTISGGTMVWNLTDLTTNEVKLSNQTTFTGNPGDYFTIDGMLVIVAGPPNGMKDWDIPAGTRRFTWAGANFEFEGYLGQEDAFNGAIGYGSPSGVFGGLPEAVAPSELVDVLLVLASVPEDPPVAFEAVFDPNDENVSYGYRYGRGFESPMARPEFDPYFVNASLTGYEYQDFTKSVPLSAWDVSDPDNPRRLAVGHLENNQPGEDPSVPVNTAGGGLVDGRWWPGDSDNFDNAAGGGPREWLWIFLTDYSETPNPDFQVEPIANPLPIQWWVAVNRRGNVPFSPGGTGEDQFLIISNKVITLDERFAFTATDPVMDQNLAKSQINEINVFPNPYYGINTEEINKYNRFVTFTHLPDDPNLTVRIFNLAGVLVQKIEKIAPGQFLRWDLANQDGLPVASGLYIAYIDMPELGETKILKLAIVQEQQILDRF